MMRDIRPVGKRRPPLNGALVPVSSITVPVPKPPKDIAPFARTPLAGAKPKPEQKKHWRVGQRERTIIIVLVLLALVTGGIAALIFLPTAQVKMVLRTAPLLIDETLKLKAEGSGEGVIPGTAFFREVEVQGSTPTTGQEVIGTKARGVVQIVNKTTEEQKIKEQSRLVTGDNRLFYMQKAVTLPPGPSQVSVEVEAEIAGTEGNIQPQKLYFAALDKSARSLLYAEVTKPLAGGSGETVQVATDQDLEAARTAAGQTARGQVEGTITQELPKGWKILPESWSLEVQSFETAVKTGAREATIPYTARVAVRVMGYEEKALEDHLRQALEAHMDKEYSLFPGPLSFTSAVKNVNWDAGEAELAVRVTHTTIPNIQLPTLRGKILGQKVEDAQKYLEGLPGVRSVKIDTWPFWVTNIPRIENRVKLDIESEQTL